MLTAKQIVGVSQTYIRRRIGWIECDRLLRVVQSLLDTLYASLVPEVAAFNVKVKGFGIVGVTFSELVLLIAAQFERERTDYLFGN